MRPAGAKAILAGAASARPAEATTTRFHYPERRWRAAVPRAIHLRSLLLQDIHSNQNINSTRHAAQPRASDTQRHARYRLQKEPCNLSKYALHLVV
ncbi:MAG: hypothetical protein JNM22_09190 [Saprospiraceae bacterium]|nr:hypothetical protein [Saprospiraceae bacterium]